MNTNKVRFIQKRHKPQNHSVRLLAQVSAGVMALVIALFVVLFGGSIAAVLAVYNYYASTLPPAELIGRQTQQAFKTTKIYDRTGTVLLYEVFDPQGGNRTHVPLNKIPKVLREAVIANEDQRFYDEGATFFGIDPIGIGRAAWAIIRGQQIQGASGISQQLVRNVVMTPEERIEVSLQRKIKEAVLAIELNRRYGKDEIFEMYLNTISYGRLAYGVEAAAQAYFGKRVEDLTLAEATALSIIPQFPAANSPCEDNPYREQARVKQHVAIDAMLRQGYITTDQAIEAKFTPIKCFQQVFDIKAPHFVFYVRKLLEEQFGATQVYQGGLKVITTLDMDWQSAAEELAREQIAKLLSQKKNVTNAALVAIDPRTGEIKTMVGSIDYFNKAIDGQVNIALANRQPGSSFKLFTYLTAFEKGYTPATMLLDVRTSFPDPPNPPYVPENYTRSFNGPTRVRQALARSYNVPAVEMLSLVSVKPVVELAHRMGINTLNKEFYGLALTLGGGEVALLDLTYAYGVVANQGVMAGAPVLTDQRRPGYRELNPVAILKVEDSNGKVLYEYKKPETKSIVSPQVAYLMTDILSDNGARAAVFGSNSALKLSRLAAAKTGTTNDFRDNWTLGYTPQLVVGVWAGNNDNSPMDNSSGSTGAAPIWHDFMEYALKDMPIEDFQLPENIVAVNICATSGLLPSQYCPNTVREIFIKGTEPTQPDNIWQPFRICKPSGKLATIYCPADQIETKTFPIYPPKAADWVRETNVPQPPTDYDSTFGPQTVAGDVAIITPKPYAYVRGLTPIVGNARAGDFQLYRLEYGTGLDPNAWTQLGGDHNNQVDKSQLEVWDTTKLADGLYTLQLIVVHGNGVRKQNTVHVNVDNRAPTVRMQNPSPNQLYVAEDSEEINIQVDARDNMSMDRVEFFVDGESIGFNKVAPFTRRWKIKMWDKKNLTPGDVVKKIEEITNPDGSKMLAEVVESEVIEQPNNRLLMRFRHGGSIIVDSGGYTETHVVHIVAYDAAGNATEGPKIPFVVIHKPKKTSMLQPREWLLDGERRMREA